MEGLGKFQVRPISGSFLEKFYIVLFLHFFTFWFLICINYVKIYGSSPLRVRAIERREPVQEFLQILRSCILAKNYFVKVTFFCQKSMFLDRPFSFTKLVNFEPVKMSGKWSENGWVLTLTTTSTSAFFSTRSPTFGYRL